MVLEIKENSVKKTDCFKILINEFFYKWLQNYNLQHTVAEAVASTVIEKNLPQNKSVLEITVAELAMALVLPSGICVLI